MGLFDFFKKKSTSQPPGSNQPDNLPSLESLLQRATTEPAIRQEFYERLLSDQLVVVTQSTGRKAGELIAKPGDLINIVSFPDGKIPFFTSTDRIFDKGVIKTQVEYTRMAGRDLFQLTKGATLLLNVYSDYGKEFLPSEIERMLDGTVMQPSHKEIIYAKETKVLLGQPAVYPTEIIKAVVPIFEKHPQITAAYMGWMHDPTSDDPPHYIFGIEGTGDIRPLMAEAGRAAQEATNYNQIIDFAVIQPNDSISDYLTTDTKPFYRKSG